MRIGKLRHRVTIEKSGRTQDPETGEITLGWQAMATVWATVEPLSAKEFIAAQAGQSEVTARIKMRYRGDIGPTMRAKYRGQVYNIHGVLPDPHSGRHWVTLPVSRGVNDGE